MNLARIQTFIGTINLWKSVRIVPFVFALHEFEEWNILSWHRRYQSNIPDVSDIDLRTIFLILIIIVFLFFYFAQRFKNKNISAYFLFPVLSLFVYNGLVHLYWSFYFSSYAPGLIFGFFVGVPLISMIIYRMMSEKLISRWYAASCAAVFLFMFINVILMGDRLESGIVHAMILGRSLATLIWF
jgi:hypothetical protein